MFVNHSVQYLQFEDFLRPSSDASRRETLVKQDLLLSCGQLADVEEANELQRSDTHQLNELGDDVVELDATHYIA